MFSKTATKSINHSIFQFIKYHERRFSYETRYSMTRRLVTTASDLHELGYIVRHIRGLKQKHIQALVDHWQAKGLSAGTIKNRLADLRFICREFGRASVVKSNQEYGIAKRVTVPNHNKAIHDVNFDPIHNEQLKVSLSLQQAFGLRREECLKIQPHVADHGDRLALKGSWTKGNVPRSIPIRTEAQRQALEAAKQLVGQKDSMIPNSKSYIVQREFYDKTTNQAGLRKLHGLRHAYAQQRYKTLTGWESPLNGGKPRKAFTKEERLIDRRARLLISRELGHDRVTITATYIG